MTIQEAYNELLHSEDFTSIAKQKTPEGARYRVMKGRFLKGEIDNLAMVRMLIKHGYVVDVSKEPV